MVRRAEIAAVSLLVTLLSGVGIAAAQDSWRGVATPPPPPPPPPPPAAQVLRVPSNHPRPVFTTPLAAGAVYTVEVSGVFSVWPEQRDGVDAYYAYAPRTGPQPQVWNQLQVDDRPLFEIARGHGDAVWFNPAHVYTTSLRGTGRPVKLQILDARNGSWRDNFGELTVRIFPQAAYAPPPPPRPALPPGPPGPGGWRGQAGRYTVDETVTVPADRPDPSWSRTPLAPGAVYVLEVSGVFSFKRGGWDGADAFYMYGGGRRHRHGSEFRPQLLIDDRSIGDIAREQGGGGAFNPNHSYTVTIRGRGQPLKLQTTDARNGSWHDNRGALTVRILRR